MGSCKIILLTLCSHYIQYIADHFIMIVLSTALLIHVHLTITHPTVSYMISVTFYCTYAGNSTTHERQYPYLQSPFNIIIYTAKKGWLF